MTQHAYLALGIAVLKAEAEAVTALIERLDLRFEQACELILSCKGRIVVTGMGKSGHISNKIAATLASTGSPAFFMHPGEASHGDLGMITKHDLVIALSNSGETNEITLLLPMLKRMGIGLIALTGKPQSTLAISADIHLDVSVSKEACPLGLAPTSSTTASLAMGDALAVAVLQARGFTEEDFAMSHPGGNLGRRLLLRVSDIMHTGNQIPLVNADASLKQTLLEMTRKGLGMAGVINSKSLDQKHHILVGIYTDGDLRRTFEQMPNIETASVKDYMTANCITIQANSIASEALKVMQDQKINGLMVVDENNIIQGALNMHDLLRAGIV
ncbi:MAG: arabinose-5-phosphate isomerase [Gammaproteobacteria bacterium]|jgi:arabinose-5-phosphate isomerase